MSHHRMTNAQVLRARELAAEGVTLAEIGQRLGFSERTIQHWVSQTHRLPCSDVKLAEPSDGKPKPPYHRPSCTPEGCEFYALCMQAQREHWIKHGIWPDPPCFAQLERERLREPPRRG